MILEIVVRMLQKKSAKIVLLVSVFAISIFCLRLSFAQIPFSRHTVGSHFGAFFIKAFDLNKDGNVDIISGHNDLAWWKNDGTGHFSKKYIDGTVSALWSIYPVDVDGDGDIDLLIADSANHNIVWYRNENFNFTKIIIESNFYNAESVAGADFDRDGDVDIVGLTWANSAHPGIVAIWKNNGRNQFSRQNLTTNFGGGHKLTVTDIDKDGNIDIVACSGNGTNGLCWFENNGHASFIKHRIFRGGVIGFTVIDFDGNGTSDIIFSQHSAGKIYLAKNNGNGSFSNKNIFSGLNWPHFPAVADLNGDGRLDVIVVNRDSNDMIWLENNGGYNFKSHPIDSMSKPFIVDVADFNNDHSIDIVSGSTYDKKLWWWANESVIQPQKSLAVIYPNGGEELISGSDCEIQWQSQGNISAVGLTYSTNNGTSWQSIQNSTTNDGRYIWQVPLLNSSKCFIKIKDTNSSTSDRSDNIFTIIDLTPKKSLTLISPNGGENLVSGEQFNITWQSVGDINEVSLLYSLDNGANWQIIHSSTQNDGQYLWRIPDTSSRQCLIKISDANNTSIKDVSDDLFAIKKPLPLTLVTPNGGERWATNTNRLIEWKGGSWINEVSLEYSLNNGQSWDMITSNTENDGAYLWTVPSQESDNCFIRISNAANLKENDLGDDFFSIKKVNAAGFTLYFDGLTSAAFIPDNNLLSGGEGKSISVEAWVYLTKLTEDQPIIVKFLNGGWKDWGLQVQEGVLSVAIENNYDNWEIKGGNVQPDIWTHIAFTFDNQADMVKLYINGELVNEASLLKDMPDTESRIYLGRHAYYNYHVTGDIDEVRIWNYARSGTEVKKDMQVLQSGSEPGLIGYWRFDEGGGQISSDLTGNGNDVVLGLSQNVDSEDPIWMVSYAPLGNKNSQTISIGGKVLYYANDLAVPNSNVHLGGATTKFDTTAMDGNFCFSTLPSYDVYFLSVFKAANEDENFAVTSFDAALTALHQLGIIQFTNYQQIAADVDLNGQELFLDAALIAREAVGLPNLSNTFAGTWYFIPDTLRFNNLEHDTSGIKFRGIILGDVDGSWTDNSRQKISQNKFSIQNFPDSGIIEKGDTTILQFDLPVSENVLSFDLSINYTGNKKFLFSRLLPSGSDMNITIYDSNGCLRLGGYGTKYLKQDYQIAVYFISGEAQTGGDFVINRFLINNHSILNNVIVNVQKMTSDNNIPETFRLYQNYPNPFNSETQIDYSIAQRGYVSLKLYDIQGRIINTLFTGLKDAGHYQVNWNGKDQTGKRVSGGVYFLVLNFNNRMKRIIKINYLP